jgi:iron only hydrogenase large subunit-like protein
MPEEEADPLIGKYTGAATIFGRTGGVMEAALRTAYELITGTPLEKLEFEDLGTLDGIKKAAIKLGDKEIKVAVVHGLSNARKVCESIKQGGEFKDYVFIEFMACPGGCIGGGGQPIPTNQKTIKARIEGLNTDDKQCALRKSHENPEIKQIYADFLKEPVSELAHHLLHTHYIDRSGGES